MGATKDFFKEKRSWSHFKDKILDYYLAPYFSKILRTGKPLAIFDCFAGKGKFDDGYNGSPIIIAERIKALLNGTSTLREKIQGFFIEKKYHRDLSNNIAGFPNAEVLEGSFEDNLDKIMAIKGQTNVFLYVDPYGIKSLNFEIFRQVSEKHFSSLELLLNFNTAGFLREGCRLLKYEIAMDEEEISDYESEEINTIDNMNAVAGGIYWQDIIKAYFEKKINIYSAEEELTKEYGKKIAENFKYVVNIPIKVKSSHLPKYRLFFASNHEDGLILMVDNMNKKWKEMLDHERGGQGVLFEFVFPGMATKGEADIKTDVLKFVSPTKTILMKDVIVRLIMKYGITFSESQYRKVIGEMEGRELLIERSPSYTPKTRKPVRSLDYNRFRISLREKVS